MNNSYTQSLKNSPNAVFFGKWLWVIWAAILPFFVLSLYNSPSLHDDYVGANGIIRAGRLGFINWLYNNWTGRYTEMLLKAYLEPLSYKQAAVLSKIQPSFFLALLAISFYGFFRTLFRTASSILVFFTASVALAVFLNGLSSPGSLLYWFGGYTAMLAGIIASLLGLTGIIGLCQTDSKMRSISYFTMAALGNILSVGSYDTSMMMMCWIMASIVLISFVYKHTNRWYFLMLLLVTIIAAGIALSAPGNQVRALSTGRSMLEMMKSMRFPISVAKSVFIVITQSIAWVNSIHWVLGSMLVASIMYRSRHHLAVPLFKFHPVLLVIWVLTGLAVSVLPSVLVYQAVWEHSWQCVYFYFLLGTGWVLAVTMSRYAPTILDSITSRPKLLNILLATLVGLFLFSGAANSHLAYLDLLTKGRQHYMRMQRLQLDVQRAGQLGQRTITVSPLYTNEEKYRIPVILYHEEFNKQDALDYGQYFGVDSMRVSTCSSF